MAVLASIICSAAEFILQVPSDSEDSDEEDDAIVGLLVVQRKYRKKPSKDYLHTVSNYTAVEFQQHFRITIDAYEQLLQVMGPELKKRTIIGRQTIDIEKQVLSVIWLLATPDSYRSVGDRFDLGKSSLSTCFMRVVRVLCELAPRIIKWPTGEHLERTKNKFRRMGGLPNVIGCVDGTFITIKAPKEDPQSYITRKHTYAMTLQGICDADLKFTDVFVGYPGSVNDNRIFRNSDIYVHVRDHLRQYFPDEEYILGDKAYPILSWCIPPYINRGNLTPPKIHFNSVLSRTRQTIERTFALLFGRFRRLKFLDMNRTDYIPATVLAACVMHNICLDSADLQVEQYIREGIDHVHDNQPLHDDEGHVVPEGNHKRDNLCRIIFVEYN